MAEYECNSKDDTKAIWAAKYGKDLSDTKWKKVERPGYFGSKRDEKIKALNDRYGKGNWDLKWVADEDQLVFGFKDACVYFYQLSYHIYLAEHPELVDHICSFGECIDNAPSNVESGRDYTHQEAFSTHIQDIAIRNVLHVMDRKFEGPKDKILTIRSFDSNGYMYGPGTVPFHTPEWITQPSLKPKGASTNSVEDFWQSNKWICVKE